MRTLSFAATTLLVLLLPSDVLKPAEAMLLRTIWNRLTRNDAIDGPFENSIVQEDDVTADTAEQIEEAKSIFVDGSSLDFIYWSPDLGNDKPITIEFGNEKKMINYWAPGKPLKVITHGWRGSDDDDAGVFAIKAAYVASGNYNVITADWNRVANNLLYPMPAFLTYRVGSVVAELLENLVNLAVIGPSDIHVMGHSLGAHVSGACGDAFGLGKIGRITGLDPAGPGFEYIALQSERLDSNDAEFVDVIHTATGTLGFTQPIGHVDFYPNDGSSPQPGCFESYMPTAIMKIVTCSHSRSHELYADSIYHRNSFIAVQCDSWDNFKSGACKNNSKSPMGHDADPKARGIFYLETNKATPYGIRSITS